MSKRTLYAIFIGKFIFSLTLIFWTVWMTLGAGVGKDNDTTFMGYYKDVDEDFNSIIEHNNLFSQKYDLEVKINGFIVDSLTYEDIYLSQRVINERKIRRDILSVGKNKVEIIVRDKATKEKIDAIDGKIVLTMPSTHDFNQELVFAKSAMAQDFELTKKSYWNIMGSIQVGDDIGRFYLKTNAI